MMNQIIWPEHFPQVPLREGYSLAAQPRIISTDMEAGPPEKSIVSNIRVNVVSLSYYFTRELFAEFVEFFWSPVGMNGGQNYFNLKIRTQSNYVYHAVRAVGGYTDSISGLGILVSFSVETEESFN